jgi:hypothetical protein
MTEEGRRKRILEAIRAWHDKAEPRESLPLPWRGQQHLFPVVDIELEVPVLNTKSHRLRSQLESDPRGEWVLKDPWTDKAQAVVAEFLRKPEPEFKRLKENLIREGQRQAGVITRKGVLFNANRRVVALRDLGDTKMSWIRVAVLPEDAEPKELAQLELQLQLQEELKVEYSLTNELLFVEELAREYSLSNEQIAITLRWLTKKGAPDGPEVAQRRRILVLIREMQRLSVPPIPLTFFDNKLEQLKALEQKYNETAQDNPLEAQQLRKIWLAAALAGSDSVHDLRAIYADDFVEEYLVPQLSEQPILQDHIDSLLTPVAETKRDLPGMDILAPEDQGSGDRSQAPIDVGRMINILSPSTTSPTVKMPDGQVIDQLVVREAISRATKSAIGDWRQDTRAEVRLNEPVAQLREVAKRLRRVLMSYKELSGTEKFERSHRNNFSYLLRQVRKLVKQLGDLADTKRVVKK